ncbi:type II secretion system protein GspM [Pseudomonas sp. Irchel s3h17]|uniref:type II secretion system protein GspM n=1 Tax=Pseudomonas sp. Irchel s3h17 TaxID=2009182 RepID=UPI000BA3447F|nr:type II secretion system protein GspM [Pseudomonas sp. Irchel s3h17]
MNFKVAKLLGIASSTWRRLTLRERQALCALGAVLLAGLAFVGGWQPAQSRLAAAERAYQQQQLLAAEISSTQAPSLRVTDTQPLSVRLSERAMTDGLDLQQLEVQGDVLRLTLSGDARVLLAWLHRTEQAGAVVQSLTLDKHDQQLVAQLVLQAAPER